MTRFKVVGIRLKEASDRSYTYAYLKMLGYAKCYWRVKVKHACWRACCGVVVKLGKFVRDYAASFDVRPFHKVAVGKTQPF